MQIEKLASFHGGLETWTRLGKLDFLKSCFEEPTIKLETEPTSTVRDLVNSKLSLDSWALDYPVNENYGLKITAYQSKLKLGFQIQTGNISRFAYDLLKLQTMYLDRKINAACLAVYSTEVASKVGGNLANANRILDEMSLFERNISVPLIVVSFE